MNKKDNAKNFALFGNITKQQYDTLRGPSGNNSIDDQTICFVSDTGKIYTQGYEFGGQSGTTYTAGDYIKILNNSINVDYTSLKNRLSNDGIGSGTGVVYTEGRGININNNTISADMDEIRSDIHLSLSNLDDVQFPSTVSNGDVLKYSSQYGRWINGHDDTTAGDQPTINVKTEAFFKNNAGTPDTPTISNYITLGWESTAQNLEEGQDTWMIIITFQNGNAVSISAPINITNGSGNAGSDSEFIEFIYKIYDNLLEQNSIDNITQDINQAYSDQQTWQVSDYRPQGWTDQPTGVSDQHRYEYATYRIKTNGSWGQFYKPYVLSAWGEKGFDGDGVQYIYYVSEGQVPPSDPSEWTNDENFQGGNNGQGNVAREYIRSGSGWVDNPVDLSTMNQGTRQWVSIRKFNGETGMWGPYSSPALWSSVGRDGVAGGYTWKLINEVMAVGTGTDDTLDNYTSQTGVQIFNNGQVVNNYRISWFAANLDGTGFLDGAYRTDGIELNPEAVTFSVLPSEDYKILHVSINNLQNFANGALVQPVDIEILNTNDEVIETLHTALTIVGVKGGKDGQAIDLKTSVEAVHADYLGNNRNPNTIDVWALLGTEIIRPTQQSNFYFAYSLNNINTKYRLNTNSWSPLGAYESVTFYLYYKEGDYVSGNDIPNGARLIDYKQVSVIKDGAPAIGPSQYSIEFVNGDLQIDGDVWDYTLQFKASKKDDGDWEEIVANEQDSEQVQVYIFGNLVDEPYYEDECWNAEVSVSGEPETKFAVIYITTASGMVLQSLVIPIVRDGVDGTSPDPLQPLSGTVMRFTNRENGFNWAGDYTKYYDGNHVDENQIKYLDIVQYKGEYYAPKEYPANTSYKLGYELGVPGDNEYWRYFNMLGDAAFNAIIAKTGFIDNLTAEQIVITSGSGNETHVVAGMVNGSYINDSSNKINDGGNGIRIWAGSITDQQTHITNVASAPFTVDEQGHMKATGAEISGVVISDSQIAGSNLVSGFLKIYNQNDTGNYVYIGSGQYSGDYYGIIYSLFDGRYPLYIGSGIHSNTNIINGFDIDGSGKLANGNIQWDTDGNLTINGNLQYNDVIGRTQTISQGSQIDMNYSVTYINYSGSDPIYITLPVNANIPDGKIIYVFVPDRVFATIRPSSGTSILNTWAYKEQIQEEYSTTDVYNYKLQSVNSAYAVSNSKKYLNNLYMDHPFVHQYIYNAANEQWIEITSPSDVQYIQVG